MFKNANLFITDFFKSLINKQSGEDITPKIAESIQKKEYFSSLKSYDKTFTPPYTLISYQLLSEKNEIFEASVYYLCTIAKNMPKYKSEIYSILMSYCEENKNMKNRIAYIHSQMETYNLL